jgi:hypothetical protein
LTAISARRAKAALALRAQGGEAALLAAAVRRVALDLGRLDDGEGAALEALLQVTEQARAGALVAGAGHGDGEDREPRVGLADEASFAAALSRPRRRGPASSFGAAAAAWQRGGGEGEHQGEAAGREAAT